MTPHRLAPAAVVLALGGGFSGVSCILVASASAAAGETDASALCRRATGFAEHVSGVPDQLLDAISRVESGRYDGDSGSMRAWPWTINAEGVGHFYASKPEAIAAALQFRDRGIQSIDVGCMQVNLMYHPDAFASLDQAFDPQANATYAARLLTQLFQQTGSWPHAAAAYHSQTPQLGNDYQRKVLEAWAEPESTGRNRSGPAHPALSRADMASQLASLGAGIATTRPNGNPVFANPARIIRSTGPIRTGVSGRGLAAYRQLPIAMAGFVSRSSEN